MPYRLILSLALLLFPISTWAAQPNNIFGIQLAQPHPQEIRAASDLVNSNGGKWGYVTLVIQENDRNKDKWQNVFDELRELHLIPIIRLATQPEGENWRRPEPTDANDWADFLDSLNWVVKDRYIILFNEPNHGSEWGGEVDEKSYANVAFTFAKALKEKNSDFFIMLAGFDASAPSWFPGLEDEEIFLQKILTESKENIFNYIDGWSSHSYPNPAFSGSPWDYGRGTVRTYDWELGMLGRLGINKELPVFITETGWKRGNEITVAENFQTAFNQVWNQDSRVKAVTPFILDYQGPPFLEFSWKKHQSDEYYQQYYSIQSINKTKGDPVQLESGFVEYDLPHELVAQSKYNFRVTLKNQGQAIWDKDENYELRITNNGLKSTETLVSDIKDIKQFEEKSIDFSLKTTKEDTNQKIKFTLTKNNQVLLESKVWKFNILPLPDLNVEVNFWPIGKGKGTDFELQLFDIDERLVFKKKGVKIDNGQGLIKDIQNVAIDELYRVVILRPGYLPRQTYTVFKSKGNNVKFKSMLPFDLNSDGKFDLKDFLKIFGR